MDKKVIKAALLGVGTVGGGVYKLAEQLKDEILSQTGASLEIKKILVRNKSKKRPGIPEEILTDNWEEIVKDPEIQIVVEVMGGIEPALTYMMEALAAGKQVVTANKDLLAEHGKQVMDQAGRFKGDIQYEAAVAGAIPIVRALKQSLGAGRLTEVMGIVNGTTNYILTRMSDEGMDYGQALKLATDLGYAEADPTSDVEGYDAGRKLAIMASMAFHSRVTFSQVHTEGITKITAEDIRYAKEFGYVVKLIAMGREAEDGIEVKVHPVLLPDSHPLASVKDSFNAVFVHGEACGDAMFMGRGAGEMPTASAVVGDIIDTMGNILHDCCGRTGCSCYRQVPVKEIGSTESRYFMRIQVLDKAGALANSAGVLGNNDVSIAQVVQKKSRDGIAELVIITDKVLESHFNDAIAIVKGMSVLKEISGIIRVY